MTNLLKNGTIIKRNLLGFLLFCLVFTLFQGIAITTMWLAALANVNTGLITVIWAVNPFFMSVVDYILFKRRLLYYHWIGLAAIVLSTVILSLRSVFQRKKGEGLGTES